MTPARLTPLTPGASLTELAAEALRERLLRGEFAWGERLSEAQLARELGVSRGPVREAFRQLRAEGLVRDEPRRGVFVIELSAHDVDEIYDLRAALELRAVRRLKSQPAESWLPEVEAAFARLREAAATGDRAKVAYRDFDLHDTVCRLSGNGRLHAVFTTHASILRTLLAVEEGAHYQVDEIAAQHEPLVEALRSGTARRAENVFDRHLEDAKERLRKHVGA